MQAQHKTTATVLAPCVNTHAELTDNFGDKKTSNASDRYQILPALKALENLNIRTRIFSLNKNYDIPEIDVIPEDTSLCIAAKMRSHPTLNDQNRYAQFHLYTALTLKRNGAKLITLYSDNVIANGSYDAELYKNLLYYSDWIITPTDQIASYAKDWAGSNTKIKCVKDPILIKQQPFLGIECNKQCNLIWFGHNRNFQYLASILPRLVSESLPNFYYELTLLTTADSLHIFQKKLYPLLPRNPNWKIRLVRWQIDNQPNQLEQELGRAHISLLPSNPEDPLKRGASHNRLTDSIQSGCITLASPLPAYLQLSEMCLIGNDFSKLLNIAIADNQKLCEELDAKRQALRIISDCLQ